VFRFACPRQLALAARHPHRERAGHARGSAAVPPLPEPMRSRPGSFLLAAGIGFVVGAIATYVLTLGLSPNTHDLPVEAAMTGAFVGGPAGALLGVLWRWLGGGPRSPT
jgi:hypothetical protein